MAENKDKKVLNVPNLRFPEFEGEWEEHYLSDYLDFKNGLNPKPERFGKGIRFISVMDILNNAVITNDCIRASVDVSEEELLSFCVENGDILFQRSSETLEDVGRANVYMDNKPAVFGGFVIRGKKKAEYDPLFFRYLLASPFARKKIIPMGAGAQHFNIGQEGLNKVKLHFALLDEQKKIARLLSLLDERIAIQNKIIEDLKKLKCAIIEKHYRQAKLHKYKICDLGVPFSVGSLSKEDLSEKGHECILYGELFTTYDCVINEIKSHTNKIANMTLSQKRDLLFPSSTTVDAVSLISPSVIDIPNVVLGGDMFGIHIDKKFNAYYLSYYINIITRKKLAIYAKGSTIIHLHYKDIAKAQLLLPDLCEQDRIAKCMMAEDDKIKVEEQLMTKLEEQKQYLLRQMFI